MKLSTVISLTLAAGLASATSMAQTTLEVSSWKGGASEIANFPAIIKEFEQQHPDIKIKLTFISRPDTTTVMPARLQGGNPPDVMMVDREFMHMWAAEDQLLDLSQEPWVEKLQPALVPEMQHNGKTYFMMLELTGIGMFANMDLLQEAGVNDIPRNIDQLTQACQKLYDKGITPMLMPASSGWTPGLFTIALGLAGEGEPDLSRAEKFNTGELKFSEDKQFIEAVTATKKMADANCFDARMNAGIDPWTVGIAGFQSGRAAMLPQGMWNIASFSEDNLPANFRFGPLPGLAGDTGVTLDILGPGWAIPKDSKQVDAAKKWIEFWANDDVLYSFLVPESGVTTLVGGRSGVPDVADSYVKTRESGYAVFTPEGHWHPNVPIEAMNSMTSYMLDLSQDPVDILKRWDQVRERESSL